MCSDEIFAVSAVARMVLEGVFPERFVDFVIQLNNSVKGVPPAVLFSVNFQEIFT